MPETSPYITYAHLEEYLRLQEERKALARQSADLGKQLAGLASKITAFVRAEGGSDRTVIRSGYVLALKSKKGSVAWKAEFVRLAGEEAAEKLIAAAEPGEELVIESV